MTKMRILIATGGTGGHIYPAIALGQQLKESLPECKILFMGGGLATSRYFDKNAYEEVTVAAATFARFSPKAVLKTIFHIGKGIGQSIRHLMVFKPDIAVGFGSFYSLPPLIAAKLLGIPFVLYEANSIPGKANRLMSRWAKVTGVHFPNAGLHLKGKSQAVRLPLRQDYVKGKMEAAKAKELLGLKPSLPLLLIFGGSQGARVINDVVEAAFRAHLDLIEAQKLQVLHITGDGSINDRLKEVYARAGVDAKVKTFENRMDIAWQAASLAICRAGAATIAELLEFEVPALLVPFAKAADNHQEYNADFVAATVGGAVKVIEKNLTGKKVAFYLAQWLHAEGVALEGMRQAIAAYKDRAPSIDLCSLIQSVLRA